MVSAFVATVRMQFDLVVSQTHLSQDVLPGITGSSCHLIRVIPKSLQVLVPA